MKIFLYFFLFISAFKLIAQDIPPVENHRYYFSVAALNSIPDIGNDELYKTVIIAKSYLLNEPTHSNTNGIGLEINAGYEIFNFADIEISASYISKIKGSFRATDVQLDYHQQDYTLDLASLSADFLIKTQIQDNVYGYIKVGAGGMYRDRTVISSIRVNYLVNNHYGRFDDQYFAFMCRIGVGLKWFWSNNFPLLIEYEKVNAFGKLSDIKLWNAVIGVCWYL